MAGEDALTPTLLVAKLQEQLQASDVVVTDTSGGCGSSFELSLVSPMFEGKPPLARHRLVHDALKEEMKTIHALSIKKCWTPAQQASQQPQ